jgi:hypothetical protein
MDWIKKPQKIVHLGLETWVSAYLEKFNADKLLKKFADIGVTCIGTYAKDPWGRAYYNSQLAPKNPKLGDRDLVFEFVTAARKYNLHPLIHFSLLDNYIAERHPHWRQKENDDSDATLHGYWYYCCPNSGYRDYFIQMVKEVILKYDIDMVLLDVFQFKVDRFACFCEACRQKFYEIYQVDVPRHIDWYNWVSRAFVWFHYTSLCDFVRDVKNTIKHFKPNIVLGSNNPPVYAWTSGHHMPIVSEWLDIPCPEAHYPLYGEHLHYTGKIARITHGEVRKNNPVWIWVTYFYYPLLGTATTHLDLKQQMRSAIIANASPIVNLFYETLVSDPSGLPALKQVFSEMKKLEKYVKNTRPVPYISLLYSRNSKDWWGQDEASKRYMAHLYGAYEVLKELHYPFEVIGDERIFGNLTESKVLFLPNATCLPDDAITRIKETVASGCGLVATYRTGFFHGTGDWRGDSLVRDLFKIQFDHDTTQSWSYIRPANNHQVVSGLDGDLVHKGFQLKNKVISGGCTLANIVYPIEDFGTTFVPFKSAPMPGYETEYAAIVESKFGSGKVIYFSGEPCAMFYRFGLETYGNMLKNAVKFVAPETPPIYADVPITVETAFYENHDYYLAHLLNLTTNQIYSGTTLLLIETTSLGTESTEMTPSSPPRCTIPIFNAKVITKNKPGRAYTLDGIDLDIKKEKGEYVITLPKLEEYTCIIVEK